MVSAPRAGKPAEGRALRARGQQTVARLHQAATDVFARRGYHAARVDDIVKAADTSHGTFYLYFSDKEDLFRAITAQVADDLTTVAGALPALDGPDRGRAAVRAWLADLADAYERHRRVIQVWTEAEIEDSEAGRLGTDLMRQFTGALADRLRELGAPDVDPGIAALALVAMVERLHYFLFTGWLDTSREDVLDTLAQVTQAVIGSGVRQPG